MNIWISQAIKHVLVGGFATIVDLVFFIFLSLALPQIYNLSSLFTKTGSFLLAATIKYAGNKFWTFKKTENGVNGSEFIKFLLVNSFGLLIDVSVFYVLTKILPAPFGIDFAFWEKISVLISAIFAGAWNFCGDKFFVFKR